MHWSLGRITLFPEMLSWATLSNFNKSNLVDEERRVTRGKAERRWGLIKIQVRECSQRPQLVSQLKDKVYHSNLIRDFCGNTARVFGFTYRHKEYSCYNLPSLSRSYSEITQINQLLWGPGCFESSSSRFEHDSEACCYHSDINAHNPLGVSNCLSLSKPMHKTKH